MLVDDEGNARLTGFHLSSILSPPGSQNTVEHDLQHCIGDANPVTTAEWRWRAPEITTGSLDQSDVSDHAPSFTRQTDIYSFGMTVYEVRNGLRFSSLLTRLHDRSSPALSHTLTLEMIYKQLSQ